MRVMVLGTCLALLVGETVLGAELPEPVVPAGVGVNVNFTKGHEHELDRIAAAGFKFIRMDFHWTTTERTKGQYDWSAYDELTRNLDQRGLRAMYIVAYSNGLYEELIAFKHPRTGKELKSPVAPQHPASVAAFARWAGAAAKHFSGRKIIWEIWNEPNHKSFWRPRPDAKQYSTLLSATAKAMREADPKATIVAPASAGFTWPFFDAMFQAGTLADLDAVSVHPYRSTGPETAWGDYQKLRELIVKYAPPAKRALPILSGEWGYSTYDKGLSPEDQAAYFVRQQLANLLYGIPLSIWYDWRNDGTDPTYNEHNFGTVTHDLQPKPAYLAAQTMTRQLAGHRVVCRLDTPNKNDWVLRCQTADGRRKYVAWTTVEPHDAELDLGPDSANVSKVVDIQGAVMAVRSVQGRPVLALRGSPQYIAVSKQGW